MIGGIYAIRHVTSQVSYIGRSVNVTRRWRNHRFALRAGKHHAIGLQRAWAKYGESAFEFVVLESCDDSALLRVRESHWLLTSAAATYNCMRAEDGGVTRHSVESREKMSAAQRSRGYTPSAEHLLRLQQRRRETVGWSVSSVARQRMSEAALRKPPASAQTREKLRAANRQRPYRLVRRVSDGVLFRSLAEAGRAHGVTNGAVCNAIRRGGTAGGQRWEYAT